MPALIAIANCASHTSHCFSPLLPDQARAFLLYRLSGGRILFGYVRTVLFCFAVK